MAQKVLRDDMGIGSMLTPKRHGGSHEGPTKRPTEIKKVDEITSEDTRESDVQREARLRKEAEALAERKKIEARAEEAETNFNARQGPRRIGSSAPPFGSLGDGPEGRI